MRVMLNDEAARQKREREIFSYLQQKLKAKALRQAVKPESREIKKAAKNLTCTFCRNTIIAGQPYVSFKSQGSVVYRGKVVRTERMHEPCLNRYLRPGVTPTFK